MKSRVSAACIVLFAFVGTALCQNIETTTTSTGFFGVSLGINDFHEKDKYLSHLPFRGIIFASGISYQLATESSRHRIDGFFSTGNLNTDLPSRDLTQYVGSFSYSFVHTIASSELAGHPLEFFVGGGVSSFVANTDFVAPDEWNPYYDQSWYWSHSLNLILRSEYHVGERSSFAVEFSMPMVRFVSRPDNGHWLSSKNGEVSDNFLNAAGQGKIEYVWENLVLLTSLEYRMPLSERVDFRGSYQFGYVSSDRPHPEISMGMYMNRFLVGIDWQL